MIIWYATRTGRRLHLATTGARRTLCNRYPYEPLFTADSGKRDMDHRPTCADCTRIASGLHHATGTGAK